MKIIIEVNDPIFTVGEQIMLNRPDMPPQFATVVSITARLQQGTAPYWESLQISAESQSSHNQADWMYAIVDESSNPFCFSEADCKSLIADGILERIGA
jgi:hypothetical protein